MGGAAGTRVSRGEGGIDPPAPIHPYDARRGGRGIPGKSPWLPGGGGKGSRPGSPGHRARPGGGSRKGR